MKTRIIQHEGPIGPIDIRVDVGEADVNGCCAVMVSDIRTENLWGAGCWNGQRLDMDDELFSMGLYFDIEAACSAIASLDAILGAA